MRAGPWLCFCTESDYRWSARTVSGRARTVGGRARTVGGRARTVGGRARTVGGRARTVSGRARTVDGRARTVGGRAPTGVRSPEPTRRSKLAPTVQRPPTVHQCPTGAAPRAGEAAPSAKAPAGRPVSHHEQQRHERGTDPRSSRPAKPPARPRAQPPAGRSAARTTRRSRWRPAKSCCGATVPTMRPAARDEPGKPFAPTRRSRLHDRAEAVEPGEAVCETVARPTRRSVGSEGWIGTDPAKRVAPTGEAVCPSPTRRSRCTAAMKTIRSRLQGEAVCTDPRSRLHRTDPAKPLHRPGEAFAPTRRSRLHRPGEAVLHRPAKPLAPTRRSRVHRPGEAVCTGQKLVSVRSVRPLSPAPGRGSSSRTAARRRSVSRSWREWPRPRTAAAASTVRPSGGRR